MLLLQKLNMYTLHFLDWLYVCLICWDLKDNFYKSRFGRIGVKGEIIERYSSYFNYRILHHPFSLFGYVIGANPNKKETWDPIITKFTKKFASRKHNALAWRCWTWCRRFCNHRRGHQRKWRRGQGWWVFEHAILEIKLVVKVFFFFFIENIGGKNDMDTHINEYLLIKN